MSIRWGDSDSSDDEAPTISASSLTRMHQERQESGDFEASPAVHSHLPPDQQHQQHQQPKKGWGQGQSGRNDQPMHQQGGRGGARGGGGGGGRGGGGGGGRGNQQHQHQHQQHQSNRGGGRDRGRGGGGGARGSRGGGGGGGGGQNWKELAKSSSKFGKDSDVNLDGGSWMAQRRAKQQQQQEEHNKERAKEKEQQEEEKRQRRKSQLQALKAAVQTIEETQPPAPVSSLQAASGNAKPPQSPLPTKILKRRESENELDDESVTSLNSHSSGRGGYGGRGGRGRVGAGRGRYDSGRGRGRDHDRRDSERSIDSRGTRGSGKGHHDHRHGDGGNSHTDPGSHSSGRGRAGRDGGRGGGRQHDGGRGRGRGRNNQSGRGRGRHQNKGKLEPGKPQMVRTPSGTLEYHIDDKPKTEGKLMNNGTVRLKKNPGGRHNQPKKNVTRSPIRTRLEIGADDPK